MSDWSVEKFEAKQYAVGGLAVSASFLKLSYKMVYSPKPFEHHNFGTFDKLVYRWGHYSEAFQKCLILPFAIIIMLLPLYLIRRTA